MNSAAGAENMSDKSRRRSIRYAIGSTIFGCVAEQIVDSNTLIILYLVALGGNESFSMLSSCLSSISVFILMIPLAGFATRVGLRLCYSLSVTTQCAAFLLMAGAPIFAGEYARYVVIVGCLIYNLMRLPYSVAWYPMLDVFLRPEDRGKFFGIMRFSYNGLNMCLIFLLGLLMGENPPIWVMQVIIAAIALINFGRKVCMDRMPDNPEVRGQHYDLKAALTISVRNAPLVGFSVYQCVFYMATAPVAPLAVIYMKNGLDFGVSTMMIITTLLIGGQMTSYTLVAYLMRKMGIKWYQFMMHTLYVLVILGFCMIVPGNSWNPYFVGALIYFAGMGNGFCLCLNSTEMMALARPGNKVMAMAFCSTLTSFGTACGRFGVTLILAAGILAADWKFGSIPLTSYNFLFMVSLAVVLFAYVLMLLCPSVVPKHEDSYNP